MLSPTKTLTTFAAAASLSVAPMLAHAGNDAKFVPVEIAEDSWEFSVSPYLWAAGLNGFVGANNLVAEVDVPFEDIWDTLDFAMFLAGDARKGNWVILTDLQYVKNSAGEDFTNGDVSASIDVGTEQFKAELAVGYVLYETEQHFLQAHAGALYTYVNTEVDFSGPGPLQDVDSSEGWVDPVVGLKYSYQFTPKWSLGALGEVGGFGVNSDELWQVMGLLGYDINEKWKLLGGYRIQSVDYEDDGFLFDTDTEGLVIGATYTF
jgi:hypothetical protein